MPGKKNKTKLRIPLRGPYQLDNNASKLTWVQRPNPKRYSGARRRYYLYKVGMSIMDLLRAGVTMEDLRWDVNHQYIRLHLVKIGETDVDQRTT